MQKELFHKILDQYCEWKETADTRGTNGDGTKRKVRKDHSDPIRGYDVVFSYKPKKHNCDRLSGDCTIEKTYSRIAGSDFWTVKCPHCKDTWKMTTQDIIDRKRKD